jgi:alpha-beta hydrolase superfamily lysophospholipase
MPEPSPENTSDPHSAEAPRIGQYVASDGYRLHYRQWVPNTPPRGYVVALHGIQSHSGWYDFSSSRLCEAGFEVRFLDRRGSGRNTKDRGHARHPDRLIQDVTQMLGDVCWEREKTSPLAPVILLGVSWGGKLAAITAARRPELVDGLALLYPGLRARVRPRWYQRWALNLGMLLGADRKPVRIPLDDPALFTAETQWQDFIRNDPLALHEATVGFLNISLQWDAEVNRVPGAIKQPLLVMLAGRDQIIDNLATRRYLSGLGTSHLVLREYAQAQHTLEFEPRREVIFADLIVWLESISRNLGTF